MLGGWSYEEPLPMGVYAPRNPGSLAADVFEGRLSLRAGARLPGSRVLRDDYRTAASRAAAVPRLPDLDLEFVQYGDRLIPARAGPIPSSHPYWEFVIGTGRVWRESADDGYSRASIPFALVEVNANCVHNGVLSFLFRADGRISKAAYQVSSETCAYLKVDLWGLLDASYTPQQVPRRDAIIRASEIEAAGRLPRRPIVEIARDYPGTDFASFAHPDDVKPADLTTWGVVVGGIHYAGGCPTRAGEYPFCDQIELPSYSLAKSMFAALALMRLERLHPGTRLERVADHVPECRVSGNWSDVSLEDLLDMASGNYLSAADQADENEAGVDPGFFAPRTHAAKIALRLQSISAAIAAGRALRLPDQRYVHPRRGDVGRRACANWARRPTSSTMCWYPACGARPVWAAQSDACVARATQWRSRSLATDCCSSRTTSRSWRDSSSRPAVSPGSCSTRRCTGPPCSAIPATEASGHRTDGSLVYNNGFWAVRVAGLPGCDADQFVPFMSGYGGISLVLMPNDVAYYYFSDGGDFHFMRALREAANIRPYCVPGPSGPQPPGNQHQ